MKKPMSIFDLRAFRLVSLAALSLILFISAAFAWHSFENRARSIINITAGGYNVSVRLKKDDGVFETFSDSQIDLSFVSFFSGNRNSRTLSLECTNIQDRSVSLTFLMRAPFSALNEEVPYISSEGYYYYLGSQLQISAITASVGGQIVDINENALGEGSFLLTTQSEGMGQVNYIDHPISEVSDLCIINALQIAAKSTITLNLQFTFVDNGTDQSVYQSPYGGSCRRRISLILRGVD